MRHGLLIAALVVSPLLAQDTHQHGDPGKLGTVKFTNSCSADVQPAFAHGMALLHSFEFGAAIAAFQSVASQDPSCGIAYWGMALAQWGNPFAAGIRPAASLQPGREFIEKAKAIGAKTDRERDFAAAASALYDRLETVDQLARMLAYRDAMAKVAAKYPADPEASAFYALSLAFCADPADKTFADRLKAGAILEKLWSAQPQHPGLAHYVIHSYDVPPLAPRALAAARRYAAIAPDAPHALHMPSHTFTRLGYWQDSIDANIQSAAAARKVNAIGEELHASDYQAYAYLQSGQDAAARRVLDSLAEIRSRRGPVTVSAAPPATGVFAAAAIPARYALERGAWAEASRLEPRATAFAYADAMTWFARALGSARSGDAAGARTAVDELQKLIVRLNDAKESYWAEQVSIQHLGASAWLALADGKTAEAVESMRAAAEREERTDKNAVSPGPLAPARELLGDMLLQLKRPKEALVEYRKTMAREPNRFRAIAGAADAATQSNDRAAARTYYRQLLTICAKADTPGRPELQTARAFK